MARVLVLLTAVFAASVANVLVQGRADTLRVLRRILKERDHRVAPVTDPLAQAWASHPTRSRRHVQEPSRNRRDIQNAVLESGHCEHIELVDCSDFETDEMTCMMTATGMTCCVCTGRLRQAKWSLF